MCLVYGDKIYLGNLGDSRSLYIVDGRVVAETIDHKPNDAREKNRIEQAGAKVTE